jgi:hypothetical protein
VGLPPPLVKTNLLLSRLSHVAYVCL